MDAFETRFLDFHKMGFLVLGSWLLVLNHPLEHSTISWNTQASLTIRCILNHAVRVWAGGSRSLAWAELAKFYVRLSAACKHSLKGMLYCESYLVFCSSPADGLDHLYERQ